MIYSPDLSNGITESFFQHIERLTQQSNTAMLIKKRITEISIELLQNIQRHSIDKKFSSLTIEKTEDYYSIRAENRIQIKEAKSLMDRIDAINKLNKSELRSLHTKTLHEASLSEKGGAGLGLYRIALRSTSPLRYTFQKINNRVYTFSLETNLIS